MKRYLLHLLLLPLIGSAQSPPPGHFAFYRDEVHEIRLRFSQADFWEQLTKNFEGNDDPPYLQASLTWGPFSYSSVGVRFKGNSSYNGASTKKKPFRIKLNEFVKGQKILGIGSFNLSNGWNDPTLLREKVYDDVAMDAGIVGPRANFAALYINDQYWGLYTLGEIVNSDFITNTFGKGNDTGNLYKAQENATLEDKGDDAAPYKLMFEKQSNEDADDWTDIVQLVQVLNRTPADQLPQKLEPILDVDSVLTALALDNLTVNTDSYAGFLAQNYLLYRRPSDNKFVFIRWDPSLAFAALAARRRGTGRATGTGLDHHIRRRRRWRRLPRGRPNAPRRSDATHRFPGRSSARRRIGGAPARHEDLGDSPIQATLLPDLRLARELHQCRFGLRAHAVPP